MQPLKYIVPVLFFIALSALFSQLPADRLYLEDKAVRQAIDKVVETLEDKQQRPLLSRSHLVVVWETPQVRLAYSDYFNEKIKVHNEGLPKPQQAIELKTDLTIQDRSVLLKTFPIPAQGDLKEIQAQTSFYSWLSILPPLVAVTCVLLTHHLVLSLFLGILAGALLHAGFNPVLALWEVFGRYIYTALADSAHQQIFLFTASLLGMVSVINVGGGTLGIVAALGRHMHRPRSAKISTALLGLVIFFDDYASILVIGSTLRPISDKLKISREKLAYIIDTTAAPVAGMALISTWIGYQVGLLQDVLTTLNSRMNGYEAFLLALPFRFYCILSVALLLLVILLNRDFGPMLKAERRAGNDGMVLRDGAVPLTSKTFASIHAKPNIPCRWYNAVIPILVVIGGTLGGLYATGGGFEAIGENPANLWSLKVLRDSFANANTGLVLSLASLGGSLMAILLVLTQRILTPKEALSAWVRGLFSMLLAMILLTLAWSMNQACQDAGTATYLIAAFKDMVSPNWLPCLIFLLAGAIAFTTGSSWSTMAIMMPTAIPLAYVIGGEQGTLLTLVSMAAVLDGAIFGDNCSPLADTTIMSSIACSSDHMDHVWSQLPYGLLALLTAAVIGYLPAALGLLPYASVGIGIVLMALFLMVVGRNPEKATGS